MKTTLRVLIPITGLLLLSACASPEPEPLAQEEPTPTQRLPQSTPSDSPQPPASDPASTTKRDFRIVTLLPPDAIPAIDDPVFLSASQADEEYASDEPVLGVVFDGEARAYSTALLSGHEIVNDTVAGRKIAVTW